MVVVNLWVLYLLLMPLVGCNFIYVATLLRVSKASICCYRTISEHVKTISCIFKKLKEVISCIDVVFLL